MTYYEFSSLLLLMLGGCVTPGPNNALLSSSGMNFGYKRSLPHMSGVGIGHAVMEFMVAMGAGFLYSQFPIFQIILQIVAIGLLFWLAYKIASAPVDKLARAENHLKPWTYWQAFWFQWINPKSWLVAIAVSGQYAGGDTPWISATFIFVATILASVVSTNLWTGFGVAMAQILNTPAKRRAFNFFLAGLILVSAVMLLKVENAPL